jgi:hypothetical protein
VPKLQTNEALNSYGKLYEGNAQISNRKGTGLAVPKKPTCEAALAAGVRLFYAVPVIYPGKPYPSG